MSKDTIYRQAAIDALRVAYWDEHIHSAKDDPSITDAITDWAIRQVKALPSAEPKILACGEGELNVPGWKAERKKGEWIKNDNGTYSCSVCQSWIPEEQHHYARYCLYCGAEMKGETK